MRSKTKHDVRFIAFSVSYAQISPLWAGRNLTSWLEMLFFPEIDTTYRTCSSLSLFHCASPPSMQEQDLGNHIYIRTHVWTRCYHYPSKTKDKPVKKHRSSFKRIGYLQERVLGSRIDRHIRPDRSRQTIRRVIHELNSFIVRWNLQGLLLLVPGKKGNITLLSVFQLLVQMFR